MSATTRRAPVGVDVLGAASCAAVAWRSQERLWLTVIVKATFDLVPDADMTLAQPEDIVDGEVHRRNNPMFSVQLTSDLAPYLPGADVVLTGHACAPEGERVQALTVRLSVVRDQPLFNKRIHVYGDRAGAEIVPFDRIPLVYERAYGGIGVPENALGTGADARSAPPNLIDVNDPRRPACFAPVTASSPARKRLVSKEVREALRAPIADLPVDVDWTYFHAAPPDQRVARLHGDEWVVLDGLHPRHRSMRSRLPDARAHARVRGPGGEAHVTLVGDTLRIDADAMRCSLVWRGRVLLENERSIDALRVVAGVEVRGRPLAWPTSYPQDEAEPEEVLDGEILDEPTAGLPAAPPSTRGAPLPSTTPRVARPPRAYDATNEIPSDPDQQPTLKFALPFARRRAAEARPPPSGPAPSGPPPWARAPAAPPPGGHPWEATAVLPPDVGVEAAPPPQVPSPVAHRWEGTAELPAGAEVPGPRLPFVPGPAVLPPPKPRAPRSPAVYDDDAPSSVTKSLHGVRVEDLRALPFAEARGALRGGSALSPPHDEPPAEAPPRRAAHPPAPPALVTLGVRVFCEGPLAPAVVPWGLRPSRDCLAVVAKVTCDLVPAGPAVPRREAAAPTGEIHEDEGAARCVHPSDLVPFKARTDVVLVGSAHAPQGSTQVMDVSFRFGSGWNQLDRRLRIFGARHWERVGAAMKPSTPEAFTTLPITYEHAYGGPRFDDNPAGLGHTDRPVAGSTPLPNLEDHRSLLRSPTQVIAPVCFAPIPLAWKERWARQGRRRKGWSALAEELDWSHYQAAPRAQQLAFLRGDEPFELAGVNAEHPVLEGTLPGLRVRCFARWKGSSGRPFEEVVLHLDTVVFVTEAHTLHLVWRGCIPVLDEREPELDALLMLTEPLGAEGIDIAAARRKLRLLEGEDGTV